MHTERHHLLIGPADLFAVLPAAGVLFAAAHTINEAEQAQQYYAQGVDLIYTDFILPENTAP